MQTKDYYSYRIMVIILFFLDLSQTFDFIHRGKMEQIFLAYGLSRKIVVASMMLYKNTKVKARSPDGDTDFFDIVAGVLLDDILAPYLFIICLDNVIRTSKNLMKENGFTLKKIGKK